MTIHPNPMPFPRTWERRTPARGFGELLARLRTERGLSQIDLAELAGIHHGSVSYLESGGRRPSLGMVARLADAMELRAEDQAELALAAVDAWRET